VLGVENLAGKGSGSGPGHAFRYPYCDPVSQGSTKPAQPHSLTAGGGEEGAFWKEAILSA